MPYTQSQINDIVNSIVNAFTGQVIAMEDGNYRGQCSAPVARYVQSLGVQTLPSMANDRADGWGVSFPQSLSEYFSHEFYQNNKAYPKGTILIWNSPHIAVVLSPPTNNTVEVFEQNADPDGAPCKIASRIINNEWHTCTYALVPIIVDAPAPPPPAPPVVTAPPSGALPLTPAPKYELLADIPAYQLSSDADKRIKAIGQLSKGTYFVFKSEGHMKNLSTDNQHAGLWINGLDNKLPVVVEPPAPVAEPVVEAKPEPTPEPAPDPNWKSTYAPFPEARAYVANQSGRVWNLDELGQNVSVMLQEGQHVTVYGTVIKDGTKHYRMKAKSDKNFQWWLCAPQFFAGRAVLTLPAPTWFEKMFHKGVQLKSIFTSEDPKFMDAVKNPYKRQK